MDVSEYLSQCAATMRGLDQTAIDLARETLLEAWRAGRVVYVVGNGGSASTASHFAADLAKYTIHEERPRFRVISLVDNVPALTAWTNDAGWDAVWVEQLRPWIAAGDVLVAFSVHGGGDATDPRNPWSGNLASAANLARDRGASVIGFSGYSGGALARLSNVSVVVPVMVPDLGTPLVESIHVVLHHFLVHALRESIKEASGSPM